MNIESVSSGAGAVLTGGSPLEGAPAPDITVVGPSADLVAPVSSFDAPAAVLVAGVMPQVIAEPVLTNDGAMRIGVGGVLTVQPQVINITGNDQTIDKTLKPNTVSTIDIGGSGNKVDYAGDPKPVIGAQANAILGGKNNSGEIDVQGTVVVKAGDHNTWNLNRPDSMQLNEKALPVNVVLEGKWEDWSAAMTPGGNGDRIFTHNKTGTTVEIPLGVPVTTTASTDKLEALLRSNPAAPSAKILEASGFVAPTGEVKQFIDWQKHQVSIFGHIGEAWAKNGRNPYTDPQIIQGATEEVARYHAREALLKKAGQTLAPAEWTLPGADKPLPKAKTPQASSSNVVVGGSATVVGPTKTAAPTAAAPAAATPAASSSARPSMLDQMADLVLFEAFPSMAAEGRKRLKKLLTGLAKQMNRTGARDLKTILASPAMQAALAKDAGATSSPTVKA